MAISDRLFISVKLTKTWNINACSWRWINEG